ncbi:MAG: Uma2 family endonuclease [Cyanobacteria bacterium P01_D01_bin.14]
MPVIQPRADIPEDLIWRMGVEQYHAMVNAGILTDDDPVELLEGWLVYKMPKKPSHRVTTRLVRTALEALVPMGWYVDSQEPITLADSEPEPDVVVVRGSTRQYLDRHPGPKDVGIVIEVSDTTLQRDRETKLRAYARSGIPIYWIVNLVEQQIEIYSQPDTERAAYRHQDNYALGDTFPVGLERSVLGEISVSSIFPVTD